MEDRSVQLELDSFIIEGDVVINYIRKPSSDIILALRQIDSNVSRSIDLHIAVLGCSGGARFSDNLSLPI